ncbi:chloride channel protein 2 isoform X2 [Anopheles ziemanni]|uniref:chloride channel protein 2 n=1 Tax=Anopheles coustani TaxID=139045 RepID=UPI0026580E2D|nr:chloride channel protein 2 [Anopheles coustani]XP_058175194.1 chloride channel protein 2 isoform X2 [Anopheles ziemanni]
MNIPIEDEYVRDFSFEPEIILRRKDSLDVQREKYHKKRLNSRRKRLKQSTLHVLAKTLPISGALEDRRSSSDVVDCGGGGGDGAMTQSGGECEPIALSTRSWVRSPVDQCSPGSALDDLGPEDKAEIRRSVVDIEIEEFYYMYGRYTKDLGEYAKDEARRLRLLERRRKKDDKARNKELLDVRDNKFFRGASWLWRNTFARLGEDWVFLALLGIIMALLSYVMDKGISMCTNSRVWLYRDLTNHPVAQYLAWVSLPVCLILFSAGFVHLVAPQSIGSGIPEMKTILRGVALKEYLTFKTLVAKVIGLTATLGSGMPLGKEGPFVHIASIVSQLLSKIITSFQSIYENESRNTEMLAAACAVGVGACFAAPIGGVLFSIEVTTTYFAVRNYWRGFFAAVCGATVFRLLAVWFQKADTVTAMFSTNFTSDFPFDPQELFVFALIGLVCGLGGALYVWVHRKYVLFMRSNKKMNKFLQKNRFLYPGIVALIVATLSFPHGFGKYIAGELSTHDQVHQLFSNFTWTQKDLTVEQAAIVSNWRTVDTNVFTNLTIYLLYTFFLSIIASTIPVPSGMFIPVFKIGAAFGRIIGEAMHLSFPHGVRYGGMLAPIIPGGYSVVGAAAFSGAVTHTVSVGVIVFEMTGQITHIVPVMIAALISNAVAALLQPSMYDSIILIKKLPYLPDLLPSGSGMYNIYVEDFMVRDVRYIWKGISYQQLKEILKANKGLRSLPIVDSPDNRVLLGSVQRYELIKMIDRHIGREKRLEVAAKLMKEAEEKAREEQERQKREAEEAQKTRRPSRFEVVPAPDILKLRERANNEMLPPLARRESNSSVSVGPVFGGTQPKKSILKKTNSFTLKGFSPLSPHSPVHTPYTTITGTESRIRSAFDIIFRKSATLQDVTPDPEIGSIGTPSIVGSEGPPLTPGISKKVQLPRERVIDMSPEDQKAWEMEEMAKSIDVDHLHIDPAPFQLVERTSILKVHSLFSMVGINHAYVTNVGRLVGVVALKELRTAIENVNSGTLTPESVKAKQEEEARALAAKETENNNGISAEDPLLQKRTGDTFSDKKVNNTITSMDSALSNSDNCSDIELDHMNNERSDTSTTTTTTANAASITATNKQHHSNNHPGKRQQ